MGATASTSTVDEEQPLASSGCGALTVTEVEAAISSLIEAVAEGTEQHAPPLIAAAAVGDRDAVRRLVQSEDGLNATNGRGITPLHWAVSVDAEPVLRSLLALAGGGGGVPPLRLDATDANGFTALHYAAVTEKAFATHLLLAAGASVNCRDTAGQTPLMKAATRDDVALSRALLDAGADLEARDAFARTALHLSASAGHLVTRLLLARGAASVAAAPDCCGRTALHYALRNRRLDAARALLPEGAYTPCADEMGRTELHWAAANGTADIVQRLVHFGPPRCSRDADGMTPLMRALEARNEATIEPLLAAPGRQVGITNNLGMTALHLAARAGLARPVLQLLERGSWAWTPDRDGRDALMWAVYSGDEETVAAVLSRAGFRQYADRWGRTALHAAAVLGIPSVVLRLLQHGASAYTADFQGWTPMASAALHHETAVVEVLRCWAGGKAPAHHAE